MTNISQFSSVSFSFILLSFLFDQQGEEDTNRGILYLDEVGETQLELVLVLERLLPVLPQLSYEFVETNSAGGRIRGQKKVTSEVM